jgi:hypothetical protein
MAKSFQKDIKPYFSQYDRDSMKNADHTGGFTLDLWSRDDVQKNYGLIKEVIDDKRMPLPDPWPDDKIKVFDGDFEEWQKGGYQS